MIHFSLFSGIGGFDLASEWMGWKNYLSCEIADFPNKILEHYWPDAYHHRDVKTLNYETINNELSARFGKQWRDDDIILTGGFPCQPYSSAGKRLGKEDERHLWPEMLRIISEIKPKFIVGENVFGLLNWNGGMVFAEVCSDLEHQGYEVTPVVIPAAAVNAPHGRDRVWFIASNTKLNTTGSKQGTNDETQGNIWGANEGDVLGTLCSDGNVTDTNSRGTQARQERTILGEQDRKRKTGRFVNDDVQRDAPNTSYERLQGSKFNGTFERREWKQDETRKPTAKLYKTTNWEQFPTKSPICSGDDGISNRLDGITFSKWRVESIKGYGNAIVPQVAFEIFKAIEKTYFDFQK